jgi:predicted nicotinamide N-methyase
VSRRAVLDLAAGGGICAIAAMRAGAACAVAADVDPLAGAAVAVNAAANGVEVAFTDTDLLTGPPPRVDLVVAGDVCYERRMTARVLAWLCAAQDGGARVLLGDPGRAYLPRSGLQRLAEYDVPTTPELEDTALRRTAVYTLTSDRSAGGPISRPW